METARVEKADLVVYGFDGNLRMRRPFSEQSLKKAIDIMASDNIEKDSQTRG